MKKKRFEFKKKISISKNNVGLYTWIDWLDSGMKVRKCGVASRNYEFSQNPEEM